MLIGTLVLCTTLEFNSCTIYNKLFETDQECQQEGMVTMQTVLANRPDVYFLPQSCVEVLFNQLPGVAS